MRMMTSARPLIAFSDATLRLPAGPVFPRTTWSIYPGQNWLVLGPGGSGKSMLVRALLGELPVVAGGLAFCPAGAREPLEDPPPHMVAHVSPRLHRELVAEAISFYQARWSPVEEPDVPHCGRLIRGAAANRAAWQAAVRDFEIEHLLSRKLHELSNGETRKVLLARAFAQRPQVLILEDPFGGLDRHSRSRLRAMVAALMRGQTAVVLVAERVEDLPAGVSHVALVQNHRLVAQGPRKSLAQELTAASRQRPDAPVVPTAALPLARRRPGGSKELVAMRKVRVAYGRAIILRDVDWTIRAGEHWALRGPNGSGKTTLLSLLLADNPQAYANDIRLFGTQRGSGESIWEVKQRIGHVSPELQYHYDGDVAVLDVVCSGYFDSIGVYGDCLVAQVRHARRWLRALGLAGKQRTAFGSLGDADQRMVLLARALVKRPRLLVLDEPCQGLDPQRRRLVRETVDRLGRANAAAIIYVTHHADELPACLTHELRLFQGRVTRRGPIAG